MDNIWLKKLKENGERWKKMKEYCVDFNVKGTHTECVFAEDENDAREKACDYIKRAYFGSLNVDNIEVINVKERWECNTNG